MGIKGNLGLLCFLCGITVTSSLKAQEHEDKHDHSHAMPEIVITADPFRPGIAEYGAAASVVEREEAVTSNKSNLGELLSDEPGLS